MWTLFSSRYNLRYKLLFIGVLAIIVGIILTFFGTRDVIRYTRKPVNITEIAGEPEPGTRVQISDYRLIASGYGNRTRTRHSWSVIEYEKNKFMVYSKVLPEEENQFVHHIDNLDGVVIRLSDEERQHYINLCNNEILNVESMYYLDYIDPKYYLYLLFGILCLLLGPAIVFYCLKSEDSWLNKCL